VQRQALRASTERSQTEAGVGAVGIDAAQYRVAAPGFDRHAACRLTILQQTLDGGYDRRSQDVSGRRLAGGTLGGVPDTEARPEVPTRQVSSARPTGGCGELSERRTSHKERCSPQIPLFGDSANYLTRKVRSTTQRLEQDSAEDFARDRQSCLKSAEIERAMLVGDKRLPARQSWDRAK